MYEKFTSKFSFLHKFSTLSEATSTILAGFNSLPPDKIVKHCG